MRHSGKVLATIHTCTKNKGPYTTSAETARKNKTFRARVACVCVSAGKPISSQKKN